MGRTYRHGTVSAPRKYTKRKLREWRDQKCIPLVGANTILTCVGRQTTPSRFMRYRAMTGKLHKLGRGGPIAMVPCLQQGIIYPNRKLRVWRDQKCHPLVGAKTILVRAIKLPRLEGGGIGPRTESCVKWGGPIAMVVFTPRQYLYQKEGTGMERPEMYSASWWNHPTYLCGPSNYPVSREAA